MGQLTTALAHELNQPLGAILRNAEAAEIFLQNEKPDLEEIRAILADIRKDDQRAGSVIERMRSLLRRRGLDSKPLDLGELLTETVVPVCSPELLKGRILRSARDLVELTLLHDDSPDNDPSCPNWEMWMRAASVDLAADAGRCFANEP